MTPKLLRESQMIIEAQRSDTCILAQNTYQFQALGLARNLSARSLNPSKSKPSPGQFSISQDTHPNNGFAVAIGGTSGTLALVSDTYEVCQI